MSDFLGAPVLFKGLHCRSPVSNPNAQLKIQLLGSTRNTYVEDLLHYCSFQTLLQVSGWLTAHLPENRVSCWLVQVALFAQLAASLHLLIGCGTVVAPLPALSRGTAWPRIPAQKVPALLTVCHHMSHFRVILFQAV